MSGLMVHIMLHGLIALVPVTGADGKANHMKALLLDAREPRDLQCFVPHEPILRISTSNTECLAAGCSISSESACTCSFEEFREIKLTPEVQPALQSFDLSPQTSLPLDSTKSANFAYVGNLAFLGMTLKSGLDSEAAPPQGLLIARMTFPFESASACSLATRHDVGGDNVHPLNFRKLGILEQAGEKSQALAQVFMARYMLPDNGSGSQNLTLTLSKAGGADPHSMVLKAGADGYLIRLENKRSFELLPDDPCDDGVARDFALYYDLAETPPSPEERLIPHVKFTQWKNAEEIFASECQGMKEPFSRPVCPIGAFYPASGVTQ